MSAPERPAVTVITAAYNAGATLPAAVASVQAQTFTDWEMIVVDDGSTDMTPRVLRRLAAAEPRLRAVRLGHNRGSGAARNVAWRAARALWIAVLDADDRWEPTKLARQLTALQAAPEAGWSFHGLRRIRAGQPVGEAQPDPARPLAAAILGSDHYVVHSTVIYRRELLAALGGFDESLRRSQDWDLFVRLVTDRAAPAVVLPDILADYTVRAGGLPAAAVAAGLRGQWRTVRRRLVRRGWALRHPRLAALAVDALVDRGVEWTGSLGDTRRWRWFAALAIGLAPWRRWRWRRLVAGPKKPPPVGAAVDGADGTRTRDLWLDRPAF